MDGGEKIQTSFSGLHKMEGDPANSRYRYHRADRMDHVAEEPRAELAAIQAELRSRRGGG